MVEIINSSNFEEKTSKGTVVVDFYADWCGPCRRLGPVFEELSGEMDDVSFFKVNVDESGDLAQKFSVMSIPTIIFFKEGKIADKKMGALPKEDLKSTIESL